jgi:Tol biopolymer transport system component
MKKICATLQMTLLLLISIAATAQRPGMTGSQPGLVRWIDDTHMLFRTIGDDGKPVISEYDCKTGKSVVVTDYESDFEKLRGILPEGIQPGPDMAVSTDMKAVVISRDNDLWYYSIAVRDGKRLTSDPGSEMNARFAPGDRKLAYTKNKIFTVMIWKPAGRSGSPLTQPIKSTTDGPHGSTWRRYLADPQGMLPSGGLLMPRA